MRFELNSKSHQDELFFAIRYCKLFAFCDQANINIGQKIFGNFIKNDLL